MGYTRYWTRTEKPITKDFVEKVKEIVKDAETKGIKICDGFGEKEPVIGLDGVFLNGDCTKGLDHETCGFDNKYVGFDFCKTARKPYDYVVRKVLKVAESEGLATDISSDGENEEVISDKEYLEGCL